MKHFQVTLKEEIFYTVEFSIPEVLAEDVHAYNILEWVEKQCPNWRDTTGTSYGHQLVEWSAENVEEGTIEGEI